MEFLRLRSGNFCRIRPVGPLMMIHRLYDTTVSPPKSVAYSEEEKRLGIDDLGEQMLRPRLAMACIDLEYEQVKMFEAPLVVSRKIQEFMTDPLNREVEHPGDVNGIEIRIEMTGYGIHTNYYTSIKRHRLDRDEIDLVMKSRIDPYLAVTSYSKQMAEQRKKQQAYEDMLVLSISRLQSEGYTVTAPAKKKPEKLCKSCKGDGWTSVMDRCPACNPEPCWVKEASYWRVGNHLALVA